MLHDFRGQPVQQMEQKMSKRTSKKLSHREFVERAIRVLRQPPYKGIHVVFSHFESAFREYYGEDPRPVIEQLASDGFIAVRPSRNGVIIVLTSDIYEKEKTAWDATTALGKILSQD